MNMKRITPLIVAMLLVLSMSVQAFAADTTTTSATQITGQGGENSEKWSADKVKVSKTIEGTDIENVFDITLNVQTQQTIDTMYQDPDVALCIVMDISNTMMEDYGGGKTKYQAAIESAEDFVDQFAEYTTGAQSKIGFVAFNTDGNRIAAMQRCDTAARATTLKNTIRTGTGNIVSRYTTGSDYYVNKRYTNIEAGLKMANDMLVGCTNKNKFVIFLSDGLPTTYCNTTSQTDGNYTGYAPYSTPDSGAQNTNGVFRDKIKGEYCRYATNYSDKGAIRARQMATTLKNNGITVYTIGAGLNTFGGTKLTNVTAWNTDAKVSNLSGEKMIQNQMARAFYASVSTIDNNFNKINSYNASTINNYHWEIGYYQNTYHPLGTGTLFENWLKYSIGSNQYIDTSKTSELINAFKKIFEDLEKRTQEEAAKAWVVTDPMGTNLEFIGFYDKDGNLVNGNLSGSIGAGKENTATKASDSRSFNWQLQKSGYIATGTGTSTVYSYTLKYRIRLTNEEVGGFVEGTSYNTNGTTTLTYQTIVNASISDMKSINFPIPSVKGYLGELSFKKADQFGRPVAGAQFKLEHDTANCTECKGNHTSVADTGNLSSKTAVSVVNTTGTEATVTFTDIPSGHIYKLTETTAPAGYSADTNVYKVTVAYDQVTTDPVITDGKITDPMDEYEIQLKKIDGKTQREKVLAGAVFEVYADAALTIPAKHPDGTDIAPLTTDVDGKASLGIVDINTTYYLKETASPAGYHPLPDPIEIKVTPDAQTEADKVTAKYGDTSLVVEKEAGQTLIYLVTVSNTPGVELPDTGGSGTLIYTLGGLALIMASAIVYGFRLRRGERRIS